MNSTDCVVAGFHETAISGDLAAHYTPDDLLHLNGPFEFVGGELVEKQMSFLAGRTATCVISRLREYPEQNPVEVADLLPAT